MKLIQTTLYASLILSCYQTHTMQPQKQASRKQSALAKQQQSAEQRKKTQPKLPPLPSSPAPAPRSGERPELQAHLPRMFISTGETRPALQPTKSVPDLAKVMHELSSLQGREAKHYNGLCEQISTVITMAQQAEEAQKTTREQVAELCKIVAQQQEVLITQGTQIAAILAICKESVALPNLLLEQLSGLDPASTATHTAVAQPDSRSTFVPSKLRIWTGTLDNVSQDNIWIDTHHPHKNTQSDQPNPWESSNLLRK